jgi:hypothetical protein
MQSKSSAANSENSVASCGDLKAKSLSQLFQRLQLEICWVADDRPIPGSHFGDREAGLIGSQLFLRADTPVHSALHESCHYVCMDAQRRESLHTDAGGDYDEENAVCYLSILLADYIEGFNRERMMLDMDHWGYSFRLGSAREWFHHDAQDALAWLLDHGIIDDNSKPTWQLCL